MAKQWRARHNDDLAHVSISTLLTSLLAAHGIGSVCHSYYEPLTYSDLRGANYGPSDARNDVAIWMDFDPVVIDRETRFLPKHSASRAYEFFSSTPCTNRTLKSFEQVRDVSSTLRETPVADDAGGI